MQSPDEHDDESHSQEEEDGASAHSNVDDNNSDDEEVDVSDVERADDVDEVDGVDSSHEDEDQDDDDDADDDDDDDDNAVDEDEDPDELDMADDGDDGEEEVEEDGSVQEDDQGEDDEEEAESDDSHAEDDEDDDADDNTNHEEEDDDDKNDNEDEEEEEGSDDDDDDDDDDEEEQTIEQLASHKPSGRSSSIKLGGDDCTNGTPAYALLTGKLWDHDDIINIPLTRLPVTLGREHNTKDASFVGLVNSKQVKQLSRLHCCIFYRDEFGGKLGIYPENNGDEDNEIITDKDGKLNGMTYVAPEKTNPDEADKKTIKDIVLRLPGMKNTDDLPKGGFFAVQNLSQQKIRVGDKWVRKGQKAMLTDGIPIQISSYCFYFLLPKDTPSYSIRVNPKIEELVETQSIVKKEVIADETMSEPPPSKRKRKKKDKMTEEETPLEQSAKDEDHNNPNITSTVTSSNSPQQQQPEEDASKPPSAKKARKSDENFSKLLELKTTDELLQLLSEAAESDVWDRNDQYVGSAVAIRAVRAAASSLDIQKIAFDQSGVTQREILDWLTDSTLFSSFERIMLSKIERKSFLTSVGKAFIRAGFTKSENNENKRAHRWDLPKDIEIIYEPLKVALGVVPSLGLQPASPKKSPGRPKGLKNKKKMDEEDKRSGHTKEDQDDDEG